MKDKAKIFAALLLSGLLTTIAAYLASVYLVDSLLFDSPPALKPRSLTEARLSHGLALVPSIVVAFFFWLYGTVKLQGDISDKEHIRGRRLLTFKDAKRRSAEKCSGREVITWGGLTLPIKSATEHFAYVGATGSGKTVSIRLLTQSIIKREATRALIYDAKQDALPILRGIVPDARIVLLNPFDARGAAWDIAADVQTPATAMQVASILIPDDKRSTQPFFPNTARDLLEGVMRAFIDNAPGAWTLRDVVLACMDEQRLHDVLSSSSKTQNVLGHFEPKETFRGVLSTLRGAMHRFEFIAASWQHAEVKVSLKDWVAGDYILVLGNDEALRTPLDAINRVIFKRLSELLLSRPDSQQPNTYLFLDEVREAGKLDGLSRLLTKGRSKGISCILGFQDIEGLRDVYGREVANELIGQCAHKAILRLQSPETARWASSLFGEREVLERRQSESQSTGSSGGNTGTTTSEQIIKRELVLASELMNQSADFDSGISGYYLTPEIGAYHYLLSGRELSASLVSPTSGVSAHQPRAENEQELSVWEGRDFKRLGVKSTGKAEKPEVKKAKSAPVTPLKAEKNVLSGLASLTR